MYIECTNNFVEEVNKRMKKHFTLTWVYLIAGATCLYKAIQHANLTGRCGVFKDICVEENKEKDKNTTED